MKKLAAVLAGLLVPALLSVGAVSTSVMAQEKMAKATVKQKVLVENDKLKAYEVAFKPGAENTTVPSSSSRVVRALKGGTLERTYADGKKEKVTYKTGEVKLNQPGPAFTTKNVGKTEIVLYIVQVK